jgi:hypothetical protein
MLTSYAMCDRVGADEAAQERKVRERLVSRSSRHLGTSSALIELT